MNTSPLLSERAAEQLAADLGKRGYAVCDGFLSEPETRHLHEYARSLYRGNNMKKAGIGTAHLHRIARNIRGDLIKWIAEKPENEHVALYMHKMHKLITALNRTCFLGLKGIEMHFACYPPGTFYEKHLDQLQINGKRVISTVLYLNEDWEECDGGQLRIYGENCDSFTDVAPVAGRLAVFLSDSVYHEVLTVNKERFSITGWMLNQYTDTTFTGV